MLQVPWSGRWFFENRQELKHAESLISLALWYLTHHAPRALALAAAEPNVLEQSFDWDGPHLGTRCGKVALRDRSGHGRDDQDVGVVPPASLGSVLSAIPFSWCGLWKCTASYWWVSRSLPARQKDRRTCDANNVWNPLPRRKCSSLWSRGTAKPKRVVLQTALGPHERQAAPPNSHVCPSRATSMATSTFVQQTMKDEAEATSATNQALRGVSGDAYGAGDDSDTTTQSDAFDTNAGAAGRLRDRGRTKSRSDAVWRQDEAYARTVEHRHWARAAWDAWELAALSFCTRPLPAPFGDFSMQAWVDTCGVGHSEKRNA